MRWGIGTKFAVTAAMLDKQRAAGSIALSAPPLANANKSALGGRAVDDEFLELVSLTDRVHRRCLHLVKADLEQLAERSVNPLQALMLIKIGHLALSPTELLVRGWYPGTNPSYNVRRLVERGLVTRERRARDRRLNALKLTDKGHHLRRLLLALYHRQIDMASNGALGSAEVAAAADMLRRIERSLSAVAEIGSDGRAATPARRTRQRLRHA